MNYYNSASFWCLAAVIAPAIVFGSMITGRETIAPGISVVSAQISGQHSAQVDFATEQLSRAFANTTAEVGQGRGKQDSAHLTVFVGPGNASGMLPSHSSLIDTLGEEGCLCHMRVTNTSEGSLAATVAVTGTISPSARGTINGAFELLRAMGFRFWSPGAVDIPRNLPQTNAGAVAYELLQRLLRTGLGWLSCSALLL